MDVSVSMNLTMPKCDPIHRGFKAGKTNKLIKKSDQCLLLDVPKDFRELSQMLEMFCIFI